MKKTVIEFGTDGFRGIIAKEFTFETLERIINAICLYIKSLNEIKKTIIVGYDPRFMAKDFAEFCADLLKKNGFRVILSNKVVPTPIVAFQAKYYPDSIGAIMLTASHNPKEYQGIKFIPNYAGPATKKITDEILKYIECEILQNNDGANAVNLGIRIGATLTIDGGEIINNRSSSGAIYGGGHITLNSGKISNNNSTDLAGAIRMVSSCNLTINGGEINNNYAATNGGAIWGYGSSTYNFNGGSMSNNASAGIGGAIYTGDYSVININNDFELCNNKAATSGAIRLTNHVTLNMNGGTVSGNTDDNGYAMYGWDIGVNMNGGVFADKFEIDSGITPSFGLANITGLIYFNVHTNHNTVNLKQNFNGFKFTVNESRNNFVAFNFKPAEGYTYVEGDEEKLICLNDGYETYWDATTSTFRLKSTNN